jgi:hypothetical protein
MPDEMLVSVSELQTYMDIRFSQRQIDAAELVLSGLQSEMEAYLRRPIISDEFTEQHVIPSYFQGVPATSFFYDASLDTTGDTLNYIQPSIVLSMRNTPVISVKSVSIRNLSQAPIYLAEALQRTASITGATQSGENVTFTAAHDFRIGQRVAIQNVLPSSFNVSGREITAVTSSTFTIGKYTETLSAYSSGGKATATGNDYTVQRYGIELYRGFPNDVVEVVYTGGLDGEAIKMFKLFILRAATREMQNMHDDTVGVKDLTTRNVAPMETGFTEKELLALRRWRRRRI